MGLEDGMETPTVARISESKSAEETEETRSHDVFARCAINVDTPSVQCGSSEHFAIGKFVFREPQSSALLFQGILLLHALRETFTFLSTHGMTYRVWRDVLCRGYTE